MFMVRIHKITAAILLICAICLIPVKGSGQMFRFRNYNTESNLPDEFVYAINQDNNGYLWLSTGKGLFRFSGLDFYEVTYPDSLETRITNVFFRDRFGTMWFGCDDGKVYRIVDDVAQEIELDNIRSIGQILEGPDGNVWVIAQGGFVFSIEPETTSGSFQRYDVNDGYQIFSALFNTEGELLLGSQDNILVYVPAGDSLVYKGSIDNFDYAGVNAIRQLEGETYLVGTNSGLWRMEIDGFDRILSRFGSFPDLDYISVHSFYGDDKGRIWVSTAYSGAFQLVFDSGNKDIESVTVYDQSTGLAGNSVNAVFQDIEGNYWFGLSGDGLSIMNSEAFSYFSPGDTPDTKNIIAVDQLDDQIFMGTPSGYYLFDPIKNIIGDYTNLRQTVGFYSEIVSYATDNQGNIWIGTDGMGLFQKSRSGKVYSFYRTGNSSEDYITDIITDEEYIWLGTLNGVVLIDRLSGRFLNRYNIDNGLPHNSIENIELVSDGRCAVALKSDRMFLIDPVDGISSSGALMYGTTINNVYSSSQDKNGDIWAATNGNGLFKIMNDSLTVYNKSGNLMSDYCYSVLVDDMNRVWTGHDRGFSRYDIATGVMKTFGSEFAGNGVCNNKAMFEAADHKLYIGTTQGFILYDRDKDVLEPVAPINNINYLEINNIIFPAQENIVLPYDKQYVIRINYVGINLKDPEKVYYQTRLENWSDQFSPWSSETEVVFSPRDGHYVFTMNSVNEDGLSGDPIYFSILIKGPFWRSWWFILLTLMIVVGIVVIVIRQREKAQKKIEEYLKTELNARTSEVQKQKEEIETQNLEITDSINYAKKIQTSILPDVNKLKDTFSDVFIFFRPRDIVSGDFYWFDKIGKDKFILVCADSTGHGVPGAFMSMIGATLLQDIVSRQQITKPSVILRMLDEHIFTTLNQNVEFGVTNDGMDMVVCEIDLISRHLRFASAMRPVILNIGGENLYLRGNRFSVGGESGSVKYFDDQEFYMGSGDTIYLFSDGLPDQFGGSQNKKLKIYQLKKLLEDISSEPMSAQYEIIARFYDEWKGNNEQVDDILLIGVRF